MGRKFKKQLKKVRYLGETVLASAGFAIFKMMSIKTASNVLGKLSRHLSSFIYLFHSRGRVALNSLALVFPEKTEKERREILADVYENLGRFAGEYVNQDKMDAKWLEENVEVKNEEIFLKHLREGRGFFGCTAHLGGWEILHRYFTVKNIDVSVIYRKQNNENFERAYVAQRAVNQIAKGTGAMKQLLRLIKEQKIIGVLTDQRDYSGERLDFFGRKALTSTALQRLSLKYDFPMIPVRCIRRKEDPNKFIMEVFPPMEVVRTGDLEKDAIALTELNLRILEEWIRDTPEQWMWVYDRWKGA